MGVSFAVRLASALAGLSVATACLAQATAKAETETEPQAVRTAQLQALRSRSPHAAQAGMTAAPSAPMDFDQAPPMGADPALFKAYEKALQQQIRAHWSGPTLPQDASCRVFIRQLPGGLVVTVEVRPPYSFDAAAKRSLESVVLKAQPLAYDGFEAVFSRYILLTIRAGEH